MFVNFYREVFEHIVGLITVFMKMIEITMTGFYLGTIVYCLNQYNTLILQNSRYLTLIDERSHNPRFNHCTSSLEIELQWAGNCRAWLIIEVLVYFSFACTMVILMIKSRCSRIGIDQTRQFEGLHLSLLIKRIVNSVKFDFYEKHRTYEQTKAFYTNKI